MKEKIVFAALAAGLLAGCVSGPKVDNTPVAALDLNRYLGEWYEIARFDHSFERGVDLMEGSVPCRQPPHCIGAKMTTK